MAYAWTTDLETGNTLIDQQHKQLIGAINSLLDACAQGRGRAEIQKTIDFLDSYTIKHFSDEEKLQVQYHYPDYVNHRQYHEGFKKVVRDIDAEYKSTGATIAFVAKVNTSIAGWLINHIKKEDVKVARHIKSINN